MNFFLIYIICLICILLILFYIYHKYSKTNKFETKPKICIYWEQGVDDAPYICNMCLKSWKKYNKNHFDIIALDNKNIENYLSNDVLDILNRIKLNKSITASSDLLRVNLLANHGGFWIDATIMCTTPILKYYDKIQTKYDFWCPFDFDSKLHTNNFLFNKNANSLKSERSSLISDREKKAQTNFWFDIPLTINKNARYSDKLYSKILDASSFKLNWILDPFMRSGDVGVSSKKTGRRFIGFEANKDLLLMSMKRIDQNDER